jgi:hypothetical protein
VTDRVTVAPSRTAAPAVVAASRRTPRVLVLGRLLGIEGNGRREKVRDELAIIRQLGLAVDLVTIDEYTGRIGARYREELADIVDHWAALEDPLRRGLREARRLQRRDAPPAAADPLAPRGRMRPRRANAWANLPLSWPDPSVGWCMVHRRRILALAKARECTHLYTLSTPHSMHVLGRYLTSRLPGVRWCMSYRDPWSNNRDLHPAAAVRRFNHRLERRALEACDRAIIYRGWTPGGHAFFRQAFGDGLAAKVVESPYIGCDEERIGAIVERAGPLGPPLAGLRVVHVGKFYAGTFHGTEHAAGPFLEGLDRLLAAGPPLPVTVRFCGDITAADRVAVDASPRLSAAVTALPYQPQDALVREVLQADVALWVVSDNVPSRVFEYVYLRRPILALLPPGVDEGIHDVGRFAHVVRADDPAAIAAAIGRLFELKRQGRLAPVAPAGLFSRRQFLDWFAAQWESLR